MPEAQVKERPILFSSPMVRAIRANIKTQTRRVVKWNNHGGVNLSFSGLEPDHMFGATWGLYSKDGAGVWQERADAKCPQGKAGNNLWVKETWRAVEDPDTNVDGVFYSADKGWEPIQNTAEAAELWVAAYDNGRHGKNWRPSIFMPRWASRETLNLKALRVERLLRISEDDAIAEGLTRLSKDGGRTFKYGIPDRDGYPGTDDDGWAWHEWNVDPRKAYFHLWDKINGVGSAQANPFVWVETFGRLEVR